jgi:hypothetical protein
LPRLVGVTVPYERGQDQGQGREAASGPAAGELSGEAAPGAGDGETARLELKPMEVDLVLIVGIGTALFAVAFLILYPMHASLERDGHGRWPWVALSGAVLGLMGLVYCFRRAQRMSKVNAQ